MATDHARQRLAALSRHLGSATMDDNVSVQMHDTKAEERPTPLGGTGTLSVTDDRTGKTYKLQLDDHGHLKANDLKQITAGGDGVGLRTYDPGLFNTATVKSTISFIDGDKGILRYRGYPIEQLAEKSSFLEVAYLLVYGHLPLPKELARWEEAVMRHSAVPVTVENVVAALPHDSHFMGILLAEISALSTCHPEQNPALAGQNVYQDKEIVDKQILRLIGKAPAMAALAYHRATGRRAAQPNQRLGYGENFLYMLDAGAKGAYKPNPRLARAIEILFILHAEHEMNCSTAAVRHLASSGVDVYSAVSGGVGALYGPLHGGANEAVLRMLERIGSTDNIPGFIEGVKNRKEKLFGFGHRVYKNFDPRAKIIREIADEVFQITGRDPLIDVAIELEKAARSDEFFTKRKLYPNVDFYSGLVYRALGFPPQFFTVLFAVPRIVGYVSHWRESLADPDVKIMRPQQDYRVAPSTEPSVMAAIAAEALDPMVHVQGVWLRDYTPLTERREGEDDYRGDDMGRVPPSNAYQRRVAGTNWT